MRQHIMQNNFNYNKWLITGVEDGWIYVDKETWEDYLKAKKEENNGNKNN